MLTDFFADLFAFIRSRNEMRKKGVLAPKHSNRGERFGELLDRSPVAGLFMLIMVWIFCSVLLTLTARQHFSESRNLVVNQLAPRNLISAFEFTAPDYVRLEQEEEKLRQEQADLFSVTANNGIKANFQLFLQGDSDSDNLSPALSGFLKKNPPGNTTNFLEKLDIELQRGILSPKDKASRLMGKKIIIIDTRNRRRAPRPVMEIPDPQQTAELLAVEFRHLYPDTPFPAELQQELIRTFRRFLGDQGNLVFEAEATETELKLLLANLPAETIKYSKGELLVRRGEKVTRPLSRLLTEYARQERELFALNNELKIFQQNMLWSFILIVFTGFYLYHLHPELLRSNKRVSLIALLIITTLLCNYGIIRGFTFVTQEINFDVPQTFVLTLVPLALISVVLAVIYGFRIALAGGFFIACITALMLVPDRAFPAAMKGALICSLTALAVRSATNYRSYFVRIVGVSFPLQLLLNADLLQEHSMWHWNIASSYVMLTLGGAILTGILALLIIFCCELIFNISTNMALMVLCDYNHPLLERLKREAPGTFFHSLMVATLAEDAALAIGANPLKAKAGALFHDIGKLAMPQYFTENNINSSNQHLKLNPQMSSIIIRDHVKEGIVLAKQYHLCRTVREAIEQHHGNDLVHFFYKRALEESKFDGSQVLESQFRYNGQPPRDKEMAIISLADACEAASRSLDKPSAINIENLVHTILQKRYQDGQLRNANLTLAELDKIRISFINTIVSMKHGRLAYEQKGENDDQLELFVGDQAVPAAEEK